ncbi:MAG: alpha-D-ribose 1-methylphosphonate 5-triphosphate diphosphatase [Neomegalonema sp.]|nr:alpha-D-ribose 1-methylphosphonate 5-triphosphate diphosphatase [Neomegalonema sp.]
MMASGSETVLANARIVAPDEVFDGAVLIRDGVIEDVSRGPTNASGAHDCQGDYLLPGLVELHTDNLERHLQPRPGVEWPRRAAVAAHDGEFVSVGVTTLFDALRIGVMDADGIGDYAAGVIDALNRLRDTDLLKADHFLHLRCEICAPELLKEFDQIAAEQRIRLISLMDHTIGQRQFRREDKYREYYQGKKGMSDDALDAFIVRSREMQALYAEPHRAGLIDRSTQLRAERGAFAVASHDDADIAHVDESIEAGATIAEFPTTQEAARASRERGMAVMMGAPNLLRGFSHSGNVSALELASEGLVDILSSDYAPASLMLATFKLAEETDYGLPRAVSCVTRTPALSVGLSDRGAISPGLRADMAQVYRAERLCVTRAAWREGRRVA